MQILSTASDSFPVTCQDEFATSIVNGRLVSMEEPDSKEAVLLLMQKGSQRSFCTAVPLSSRILLTAAHCVHQAPPSAIEAVFYTRSGCPSGGARRLTVTAVQTRIHENFDGTPTSQADLALVLLSKSIPADYPTASLFDELSEGPISPGSPLQMLGYGISDEFRQDGMKLRTLNKAYGQDTVLRPPLLYFNQTKNSGGFCRGDSGAPVYIHIGHRKKVLAINSMTVGLEKGQECHTASAAMYVPAFTGWIKNKILEL